MGFARQRSRRHSRLRHERRSTRRAQAAWRRRPPRHRRIQAGHLLPDRLHRGQHLGSGARRRDGRGARQGSSRSRRERAAWPGHEHQTQPAVRTQLRVLFRGSDRRRPHGRRSDPRHPKQRHLRMPEAFRGQQPGIAPPGQQLRCGRAHHARTVPDRFRNRRARSSSDDHHDLLQRDQRRLRPRKQASAAGDPARRMGLRRHGRLRLGRLQLRRRRRQGRRLAGNAVAGLHFRARAGRRGQGGNAVRSGHQQARRRSRQNRRRDQTRRRRTQRPAQGRHRESAPQYRQNGRRTFQRAVEERRCHAAAQAGHPRGRHRRHGSDRALPGLRLVQGERHQGGKHPRRGQAHRRARAGRLRAGLRPPRQAG